MSNGATFEDCFNMLCGEKLGEGIHRTVYACKIRPDLVVKVENQEMRYFANVMEDKFWTDHRYYKKVADWLCPIEFLSPDGRLLLMRRVRPIHESDTLPDKLPIFLSDIKRENFGWLDGRLVCIDYAWTVPNPNTKPRKIEW
jgi:hypothetical protein